MPLYDMFEGVVFGFLEVVGAVEGVEPGVEEIVCPVVSGLGGGRCAA